MFQEAVGLERRWCWRSLLPNFNLHRFKTTPWPQSIIFYISYIVLTYRFKTSYFTYLPFLNCKLQQKLKVLLFCYNMFWSKIALNQIGSSQMFRLHPFLQHFVLTMILFFFQTNIKKMKCSYSKRKDKLATVVKAGSGLS